MFTNKTIERDPQAGERFTALYRLYHKSLLGTAYKMLNNQADAEDAVHQTFMILWEKIDIFEQADSDRTKSILYIVLRRRCLDILRTRKRRIVMDPSWFENALSIRRTEGSGLAECICAMKPIYRDIIILKYCHGFSNKDIAKLLSITEANVRQRERRAKKELERFRKENSHNGDN